MAKIIFGIGFIIIGLIFAFFIWFAEGMRPTGGRLSNIKTEVGGATLLVAIGILLLLVP